VDRERLGQLSSWMGFVGIITIIMGALSALSGVFAFVVGAIPGIIVIILGVKLRGAKKSADSLISEGVSDTYWSNFNMLVGNLNTYFKIQGILIIISLVFMVLGVIFAFLFGFAFMQDMPVRDMPF